MVLAFVFEDEDEDDLAGHCQPAADFYLSTRLVTSPLFNRVRSR